MTAEPSRQPVYGHRRTPMASSDQLTGILTAASRSYDHAVAGHWVVFQAETWVFFRTTSTQVGSSLKRAFEPELNWIARR
jgi:hypothetical protein